MEQGRIVTVTLIRNIGEMFQGSLDEMGIGNHKLPARDAICQAFDLKALYSTLLESQLEIPSTRPSRKMPWPQLLRSSPSAFRCPLDSP